VARELTKLHEEILRGTVAEVAEMLKGRDILGEVVIVVEGAPKRKEEVQVPGRLLELLRGRGLTQKDIVTLLSEGLGIEKNALKRQLSALEEAEDLGEG